MTPAWTSWFSTRHLLLLFIWQFAESDEKEKKMEELERLLEDIRSENHIAGMAVAVTDREKILFARGFGVESIERPEVPVTADSLFRIASVTKLFTGVTILSLVDEGRLSLDEPVKKILPDLKLTDSVAAETITLRQLLSHNAGLPAEYTPDGPLEESMMEQVLLEGIAKVELIAKPGECYLYSNWGIRLAALMAQRVTGKYFTQLVQERVIGPLGLKRTTFDLHVAASYPLCLPHTEENGHFRVFHRIQENATRHAAGGLFSNARELTGMVRLFLNEGVTDRGERILSRAMMDQMKTKHVRTKTFDFYGLTLLQSTYKGGSLFGHTGSAVPYASCLMFHPDSGLGVVVLMNTDRQNLRVEIVKQVLNYYTADQDIV